jgi:AmmeMemoRadiSam system protein B/AmmeMemoRadiSam system protein A
MRTALIVLLSIFSIMETFPQNKTTDRQPVAAGRFYPAGKAELMSDLSELFRTCKKGSKSMTARAIISPHAGYIFSGRIAASAFSSVSENAVYKNIFLIGSSHVMSFDGASVYSEGDYITPLGRASVNREIAGKLISGNKVFNNPSKAHIKEHSLEVQIPFIQYYFRYVPPIVPIIIGTDNETTIRKIAEALKPYFTRENLFIISSDFSHYPSYNDAVIVDKSTANAIISGDPEKFLSTLDKNSSKHIDGLATSMCGWTSGLTLMYLTEGNSNMVYSLEDYCNSGDSPSGGKNEVVGYNAISIFEKGPFKTDDDKVSEISFTKDEKERLFEIAKTSIRSALYSDKKSKPDEGTIPVKLKSPYGAFVTLKINGALRGCIGRFISAEPLYEVVRLSALSSAFEDPRFNPLTREEYGKTTIEITVLGPLKKIRSIDEIVLGRHGIYIKKDSRSGTMLPQVAIENHWSVEEFLGYTSRDKAGIGWDGWKSAEIFIYEGVVLEDN